MTDEEEYLFEYRMTFESIKENRLKSKIHREVHDRKKDIISFVEQISSNHYSCLRITNDISALQQDKTTLMLKYESLQNQMEEKKKAQQSLEVKRSFRLKLYNLYKENLGFEIQPSKYIVDKKQYEMLFSFKRISKSSPDKCYSFVLGLQDNTYIVTDCIPPVKELEMMLKELNKTDDLKSFVIDIRRKFCAFSTSKKPMNDCTNDP